MNMNSNPTIAQLAALMAVCNDEDHNHIIWVREDGEVFIEAQGEEHGGWDAWEESREMRFRCETCIRGNDYVGPVAANDQKYLKSELGWLIGHWNAGTKGYADYPPPGGK